MATTYPHYGMEEVPLTRFPLAVHNHTVEHSKREPQGYVNVDGNYHDALLSCGNDREVCNYFAPPDLGETAQPYPIPRPGEEVAPINPFGELECEPSPEPNAKFYDSHEKKVKVAAWNFCFYNARGINGQQIAIKLSALPITRTVVPKRFLYAHNEEWAEGRKGETDVYDLRVDWIEGCQPDSRTGLNPMQPLFDADCEKVIHEAWKQCNNKGRGGSLVAGCMRYSIKTRF